MMETVDSYKDGTTWEGVQEICNWLEAEELLKLTNGANSYKGQ